MTLTLNHAEMTSSWPCAPYDLLGYVSSTCNFIVVYPNCSPSVHSTCHYAITGMIRTTSHMCKPTTICVLTCANDVGFACFLVRL